MDPKTWDKELTPTILKLDPSDRDLLKDYLRRQSGGDYSKVKVPPGTTISMAISDQIEFLEYRKRENEAYRQQKIATQKALDDEAKAIEQAKQERANVLAAKRAELEGVLTAISFEASPFLWTGPYTDPVTKKTTDKGQTGYAFRVRLKNTSGKGVIAVTGGIRLTDALGKNIGIFYFEVEDPIPIDGEITISVDTKGQQEFDANDPYSVITDKLTPKVSPGKVKFADGSLLDGSNILLEEILEK